MTETFSDLPVGQIIQIVEGEESYSTLELKTLQLGSPTEG